MCQANAKNAVEGKGCMRASVATFHGISLLMGTW